MPNLLAKGLALLTRLAAADSSPAGRVLYYCKAGGAPIDLTGRCWVGRSLATRLPEQNGPAKLWGDRDYLIPVAELLGPPEVNDYLIETISGTDTTFEVISQLDEPCWRYSDPGRAVYRVHCKER